MPPSSFNTMEGNPNPDWEALTEARRMYLDGSAGAGAGSTSAGGVGQILLICGAALLAAIIIAMALFVG